MAKPLSGMSKASRQSFERGARRILSAGRKLNADFGPFLRAAAEEILTDVKRSAPGYGVPFKTGTLRNTGKATGPNGPENAPNVEISFGGPAAKYALIQHENLSYSHKVGEPRYLVRGIERWSVERSEAYATFQKKARNALSENGGA